MATTKTRNEIDLEIKRLHSQLEKYKKDKKRLNDVEKQLDRTLYDLGVHQEELRTQNEELNQAHSKLEGLLAKYSILFEESPVAYFVMDARQKIVESNRSAASLLNLPKAHLLSQPLFKYIDRNTRSTVSAHLQRVMQSGFATDEIVIVPKNGDKVPCVVHSQSITDPASDQPMVLSVLFDISERKRAEQQIAYLAEQNRRILDSAGDGILGISVEGLIVFANKAAEKILEISAEEMLGSQPAHLLRPIGMDDRPISQDDLAFTRAFVDGESRQVANEKFKRRRGGYFPVEYIVAPTFEDGSITGMVMTFRDITERQGIEDAMVLAKNAAEAGNRAKSEFLSIASHELRTPMNAIMGMADFLVDTDLDQEQSNFVATIKQSGRGLLTLIDDILDLSSIDVECGQRQPMAVNLRQLVAELFDIVSPSAESKGLSLVFDIAAGTPETIASDERRLRQVILHLLSNAVKFSSDGEVSLTVEALQDKRAGQILQFCVRDNGIGIAKEHQKSIFQLFTQVDSSDTRTHQGTGLGLAICDRFIRSMGGTIRVDSEPGRGSRFTFTIPQSARVARAPTPADQPAEPMPLPTRWIPAERRLLVVEDDPVNRALILGLLRKLGLQKPDVVENGRLALKLMKEKSFDLVLMDIQMPEMDGYTATREFRKYEKKNKLSPQTPIVAVTAYSLDEHRTACFKAGMSDFLTKPLIRSDLEIALLRWLGPDGGETERSLPENATVNRSVLENLRDEMGEEFQMIVELFLEILPQRRQAIRSAAENLDGQAMHNETHPLKSNCRQVGMEALAELVEEMDAMARLGKTKKAVRMLDAFEKACDEAVAALQEELVIATIRKCSKKRENDY